MVGRQDKAQEPTVDLVMLGDNEYLGTKSASRMPEASSNIEKTGGDVPEGNVAEVS